MSSNQDVFVSPTVVRGDLKRGDLKIKHDTCDENPGLYAIPVLDVRTTGTQVTCFAADPDFVTPLSSGGALNACEGVALNAFCSADQFRDCRNREDGDLRRLNSH